MINIPCKHGDQKIRLKLDQPNGRAVTATLDQWLAANDKANGNQYAIGAEKFPGLSKLIEEMGEVQKAIGRLIQCEFLGMQEHWDGSHTKDQLTEELADLFAAIKFYRNCNMNYAELSYFTRRHQEKLKTYHNWNQEQSREKEEPDEATRFEEEEDPNLGAG